MSTLCDGSNDDAVDQLRTNKKNWSNKANGGRMARRDGWLLSIFAVLRSMFHFFYFLFCSVVVRFYLQMHNWRCNFINAKLAQCPTHTHGGRRTRTWTTYEYASATLAVKSSIWKIIHFVETITADTNSLFFYVRIISIMRRYMHP